MRKGLDTKGVLAGVTFALGIFTAGRILKSKAMEDLFTAGGVTPAGGTPEQFQALIKIDIERWRKVE